MPHMMIQKLCKACGQFLDLRSFSRSKATPDGLQDVCRACQSKRWAAYKAKHADELRAKQRAYHATPEVQERKRKYRQDNHEHILEYLRKWSKANRDKAYAKERKRIDTVARNPGSFTLSDRKKLFSMYGHKYLACGSTEQLTADHVIPVSLGGSNDLSNRQLLCRSCNSKKDTRTTDFRPKT